MSKVRLGIIGMGNIGKHHADYLLAGDLLQDPRGVPRPVGVGQKQWPLLVVEQLNYLDSGQAIEFVRSAYRADRYRLRL